MVTKDEEKAIQADNKSLMPKDEIKSEIMIWLVFLILASLIL